MRDTDGLTPRQQAYVDRVIEAENGTKYRSISPGLCGGCDDCRSAMGFKPETELDYWQERDRLFIGLRVVGTDHHVIEMWDEDASVFVEEWGLEDDAFLMGKLMHPGKLLSALQEAAEDIDIPDEVIAAAMDEAVSNGSLCDEGGFSWQDCDVCGSGLGGDRYAAHGHADDGSLLHYDICTDCLCYLANGDVPEFE